MKMPFKLRLKKSRQYNVVSKSLFVVSIELLDSNVVECTLTAESIGRECLENICQRLSFQQPHFFGLRYVTRNGEPRWIELERPLKRQLDKHARNYTLYLRVMYYVNGISLLADEITRYHYFLQLKSDIIEGKIMCDVEQAILLAGYSMQAEFGNYDVERHTPEYLRDFALFPKQLLEDGQQLEMLMEAAICRHRALAGLPQGTAEEYYILAVQRLDGYGQETFLAKDESGQEVIVAVCLTGITAVYSGNQCSRFYRWKEITNVVNHKKYFGIECQQADDTTQFQFPDVETAKYLWRMCVHQHTFFIQYGQSENVDELSNDSTKADIVRSLFTRDGQDDSHLNGGHDEVDGRMADCRDIGSTNNIDGRCVLPNGQPIAWDNRQRAQSTSCLDLALAKIEELEKLRALLPAYRSAPDYETAVQKKSQEVAQMYNSHPDIHSTNNIRQFQQPGGGLSYHNPTFSEGSPVGRNGETTPNVAMAAYGRHQSVPTVALLTRSNKEINEVGAYVGNLHMYKHPPPPYTSNRPSSSTPDLASSTQAYQLISQQTSNNLTQVSGSSPDLMSSRMAALAQLYSTSGIYAGSNPSTSHCVLSNQPPMDNLGLDALCRRLTGNNMANGAVASEPIYENVPLQWMPASCDDHLQVTITDASSASDQVADTSPSSITTFVENRLQAGSISSSQSTDSQPAKSRKKWGGLLPLGGGGNKQKASTRPNGNLELESNAVTSLKQTLPPSLISKEAMCQMLEHKLEDSQLLFEFEKIPKFKLSADFTTALLPENISRNRHKDYLPYEENRVRLSSSKDNKHGYINASNITASVGDQQKFYIAAQSPMAHTVTHFWQMVWECDVYLIVSLADMDSPQYCPSPHDKPLTVHNYQVWCQFSQEMGHCVTSKIRVLHSPSRRSRNVWHLKYAQWSTHGDGCPANVAHFVGFLEELSSVRQHSITEIPSTHNKNPPVLVHCANGVSRTGLVIISDLLLCTLDHNQELDVARVVTNVRTQRMSMIDFNTYRFLHSLLAYYLRNSRLI